MRLPAKVNNSEVEGVFISCTALRAAGTIEPIEEKIGKPVITSNQALLWDALRLGGYNKVIPGYGELMEI
jgi:maleate isomerase